MQAYLNLLSHVLDKGTLQENRTNTPSLSIPAAYLSFDLSPEGPGFPAVTTKKLHFRSVVSELIGFLRGETSAAAFRELGTSIWDANANQNQTWLNNPHRTGYDDLGRIYGAQWRDWAAFPATPSADIINHIDQIQIVLDLLRHSPTSRRIIVTAWNPGELDQMCLPPCHLLFQLIPDPGTRKLHLNMYQRSVDTFLGLPFNIASYALLLNLFASWANFTPGTLNMFLSNVHIYTNHIDQVKMQLAREPYPLPQLDLYVPPAATILSLTELLADLEPEDADLINYRFHPSIPAPMAV